MNTEREFAYKIRHHLNLGAEALDPDTARRLHAARQNALAHQKAAGARLSLAGPGQRVTDVIFPYARALAAIVGLLIGVIGISIWNDYQKVAELEEIDSALLAGDLPIDAYLDKGFRAWLSEHSPQD